MRSRHIGKDGEMKKTEKNGDKMVSNHMPDTISDFVWAISGLTRAIGEEFTTSSDGGRIVSWSDGESGYFLSLVMDDTSGCHALIGDHLKDPQKTYASIGYCHYHNITVELAWNVDEDDVEKETMQ